ncbi:hypothetical protein HC024_12900 [Methylococcaceae bacterium WWC4]|nr:hypothetical protein [Methylococcaceae bacterium WWC4]
MTTTQVSTLETADLAAFTTGQVVALATNQIVALTTAQVVSMETADVAALTTSQFIKLETADIQALSTAQIFGLTTAQVCAMTDAQELALTTAQLNAMTTAQLNALFTTPLVLDLNGDGISTLSRAAGVSFDIDADGSRETVGWVGSGDGLLAIDTNRDGVINDGSELFGSATRLADGQTAADGYAALRALDSNQDGWISADDNAFKELKVWTDNNADGLSQADELHSLTELGISRLGVNAETTSSLDNGNWIGLTSSYETVDGDNRAMVDVWFAKSDQANPEADLRANVNRLAQAISSFADADSGNALPVTPGLPSGSESVSANPASLATLALADTLKQFDANGNPLALAATPSQTARTGLTPSLPGIDDPASGYLASKGK